MSNPGTSEADSGFLTIDQAIAIEEKAINAEPETNDDTAPETVEAEEIEASPEAEDTSEPETANDGEDDAETEETPEEAEVAEPTALDPPQFWDAEGKQWFSELPRPLQEKVLAKEKERDTATSKAIQEAAEKRKAADGEASRLTALTAGLDKLLPEAVETFKSRWEGVDWDKVIDEYGADQALKLKGQFEREQQTIQQLQAAKANSDAAQTRQFVSERLDKLKTVCPELVEGETGNKRQADLVEYLAGRGVPRDTIIRNASAEELSIGYKAMLWDRAQANAKTEASKPKPKVPNPAKPALKPSAPAPSASSATQKLKGAQERFAKNPSVENLLALEKLKGR